MKILHVLVSRVSLPPLKYGGTQRVIWALAQAQRDHGHEVRFLWGDAPRVPAGTTVAKKGQALNPLIGDWPDIVHFHRAPDEPISKPFVVTEHFNAGGPQTYHQNTIFLSRRHAAIHNAHRFVYNGLNWSDYGQPEFSPRGNYLHFLGKARVATKNLTGAMDVARQANKKLSVLGGPRIKLGRGGYIHLARHVSFKGMVGGETKNNLIRQSQGLLLPVRWHEPFGLAYTESLYLGCPVFATPYGAIPEIISEPEVGFLSASGTELAHAVSDLSGYDRRLCHELAVERFGHYKMAKGYEACYQQVLDGQPLHANAPYADTNLTELLPFSSR
ncbi:glycosyltransferase [Alteromonas lipotrueiana]|uniref:glycosyltransferase n=1 Tax=Alteromonas lipotrueiana TaxID=2803815 RepID=UPI001C485177|nr:glycosyltransferase [Alteromonas lipotrueiana]